MTNTRAACVALAAGLMLTTASCGMAAKTGPASHPPSVAATADGSLSLDAVQRLIDPTVQKDPDCPVLKWRAYWINSPGSDSPDFTVLDCYLTHDASVSPNRALQAWFGRLGTPDKAQKWADYDLSLDHHDPFLVTGTTIVVISTNLKTVDQHQLLLSISHACTCGHLF